MAWDVRSMFWRMLELLVLARKEMGRHWAQLAARLGHTGLADTAERILGSFL